MKRGPHVGCYVSHLCCVVTCLLPAVAFSAAPAPLPSGPPAAAGPVRIVSAKKEQRIRRFLPRVDDAEIQRILDDPRLILYTDAEMPPAYQHWRGDLQGLHSPSYNISAVDSERIGNGNREFPWSAPAGTHRCRNVTSVRFLWLPQDKSGRVWPVVWHRAALAGDASQGYWWTFPVGTVVGEVLGVRSPAGHDYAFELRIRRREVGEWAVDVFRPYPKAEDLVDRLKDLCPDWKTRPRVAALIEHLERPVDLPVRTLRDRQPAATVFAQQMGIDVLPDLQDPDLVAQLLTGQRFKSALGEVWRVGKNGVTTCAPTTEAAFHIVPARYDGGFIEADRVSCMRCHETTGQHVDRFDPVRDWYGRIRGSDGIFSFHPFAPSSISYNGFGVPIAMRRAFVAGGVVERFDAARHPPNIYNQIPTLQR